MPPPPAVPPTLVRFTGPISVERPSPCPTCCLKCPGGVCTATCNKQLLKEIFAKIYAANAGRIQKLQSFIKANKQRIATSESRVEKLVDMEKNAYNKMKQLLRWSDDNIAMKIRVKEDAVGPRGDMGPAGHDGVPGTDGAPGKSGETGAPGGPGPQGARGPQGLYGPPGVQGEVGPMGPEGPQGSEGKPGPRGAAGAQGPPSLQIRCDAAGGWLTTNAGACLRVITRPAEWQTAEQKCQAWGGHLFSPRSDVDLKAVLTRMRLNNFWVGLHRSPDGGNAWYNADESSPDFLTSRWALAMPNNDDGAENCVEVFGAGAGRGKLADKDCNARRPYYCAKTV